MKHGTTGKENIKEILFRFLSQVWNMYLLCVECTVYILDQCFSTFVRPRPGKFFFHKTRARSQQIYTFPFF